MNVTREVVHDLLPLYLAGEASADTRTLLEEYLKAHPDEARAVRELAARNAALLAAPAPALSPDLERATFERARSHNRWRAQLLAFTIAFGLLPFAFTFEAGTIRWMMWRDSPKQAAMFALAAAGCALARWVLGARLRRGS